MITKEIMNKLSYYEYNITGEDFISDFVKAGGTRQMAEHLWQKFHAHDHSILALWGYSDSKNQALLVKVINMGRDYHKE